MLGNLTVVTCSEIVRIARSKLPRPDGCVYCVAHYLAHHFVRPPPRTAAKRTKNKRISAKMKKKRRTITYSSFASASSSCQLHIACSVVRLRTSALPQCERSRPAASRRLCVRFLCNKNGNFIFRRNHLHSRLVCVCARASKWNFISFNNTKRSFSCLLPGPSTVC